jgi:hypothetical protein
MKESELRERQVLWVFTNSGIEPGGFYKALIEATIKADSNNRNLLGLGFPLIVGAVDCYQTGKNKERFPLITEYVQGAK